MKIQTIIAANFACICLLIYSGFCLYAHSDWFALLAFLVAIYYSAGVESVKSKDAIALSNLKFELDEEKRVTAYYKREAESLEKSNKEYIRVIDRHIDSQKNKPEPFYQKAGEHKCDNCTEFLTEDEIKAGVEICADCQTEQDKFKNCEGKGI